MIISRNLLAEFFPGIKDLDIDQLSKAFFQSGIEIEGLEKIIEPTGLYYGIVREVRKAEESDKLNICKVYIPFKDQEFTIVCGAKNVTRGKGVIVALPGAKLSNGKIEITERRFDIINTTSYGMICSYLELYQCNLLKELRGFDVGNIITLSDKWNTNKCFESSDFWLDDWIFDLSIPANRGDLHCAWGLSRELVKVLGRSKDELAHGGHYSFSEDPWMIIRVLLTNNHKEVNFTRFEENMNRYLYLAFNEILEDIPVNVRPKSTYFQKLRDAFISREALDKFTLKRIAIDEDKVLSFLGVEKGWTYKSDFFVFEHGYAAVPEWRDDINNERDIADEVVTLLGWERIPATPIESSSHRSHNNQLVLAIEKIRDFWRNQGFFECTTFNLHKKTQGEVSVDDPLSNDHVSLREHALNELLDVLETNQKAKLELRPVFEIFESQSPNPYWTLNVVVPEMDNSFPLGKTKISFDLYDLQSLLRKSFRYLNKDLHFTLSDNPPKPFLSQNYLNISDIGYMGYFSAKSWGFTCRLEYSHPKGRRIKSPLKYPSSYKDLSLEFPRNNTKSLQEILSLLKSKDLVSVKLIEKYETEETISYLLRVRLQSKEGTLSGEDIKRNMDELCSKLEGIKIK